MGPESCLQDCHHHQIDLELKNCNFSNTEEKDTTLNDDKSFTVAERTADFEYSDESVKDNIYVFEGSENPFVMSRVYDVNWICEYDMRRISSTSI